jgi:hypothetical protein
MIDANLKNLQKCILWFCFLSKNKNKFSDPYRNEYTKKDNHWEVDEDFLKNVKAIKDWSSSVDFIKYNTSSNRLYTEYTKGNHGSVNNNNGIYQRLWCLWDSRTKFKLLGKGKQQAIYEVIINDVLIPQIEKTKETLEEKYNLVKENNFIERDYSDEEEHEDVFYFEEFKPTATQDNIIEIPFDRLQSYFAHANDFSTWQYSFEQIIYKLDTLNPHDRFDIIKRYWPKDEDIKIMVDGNYFTNI